MVNSTKREIAASLKRLLLKKPITKITINDIARDCGISRMTFYYHFRDIYDLMEWSCEEDARALWGNGKPGDTWQQGFVALLTVIRENKPFIINIYRSVDQMQIERFLATMTEKLLLGFIEEQSDGLRVAEENQRYIANFFLYGLMGIILEWIRRDMREPPELLAETAAKIVNGSFQRAIEGLAEPSEP